MPDMLAWVDHATVWHLYVLPPSHSHDKDAWGRFMEQSFAAN